MIQKYAKGRVVSFIDTANLENSVVSCFSIINSGKHLKEIYCFGAYISYLPRKHKSTKFH